jgi:hypothetical protein
VDEGTLRRRRKEGRGRIEGRGLALHSPEPPLEPKEEAHINL